MSNANKSQLLTEVAEQDIPESLDLWPQIRSRVEPAKPFQPAPARWWPGPRRIVVGLAAAAVLAAIVVGTLPLWTSTPAVDAQEILDRTTATVNGPLGVTSYHLTLIRRAGGPSTGKDAESINAEVWYNGNTQQRSDEQVRDASGAIVSNSQVVFNGAETWIARTERGQTTIIHTIGTTWTRPADDPSSQATLTDVLAKYNNGKGCNTAQFAGQGSVAGQATYVIVVAPRLGGCDPVNVVKSVARPAVDPASSWQMRVWVDQRTFLPLKTETRDAAGQVVDSSVVTAIEYNVAIPAATFAYTPPPGAAVSTFRGGDGSDVKRQIVEGTKGQQAQSAEQRVK